MRCEGVPKMAEGEVASTEIPVVLGDKGDAMMGDGIVCRFKNLGVVYSSVAGCEVRGGVETRYSWMGRDSYVW
jgi:hypothetical protein